MTFFVKTLWVLITWLFTPIKSGYFDCSDEYFADFDIYQSCITARCGRFISQLEEPETRLIEELANQIYQSEMEKGVSEAAIFAVDLASNKGSIDKVPIKLSIKNDEFREKVENLVDSVGYRIRRKVKNIFNLKGRIWIAK